MFAQVFGTCTFGLNGHVITVEVDISRASPAFDIVGLPAVSVKESKERVQSAIRNSGYFFPIEKVTVNLAPADLKKDGSCLDLPIAMGVLAASGVIPKEALPDSRNDSLRKFALVRLQLEIEGQLIAQLQKEFVD